MQQIFLYIGRPSALIAVKADVIILDLVRRLMEPRKARNPQEGRLEEIFGLGDPDHQLKTDEASTSRSRDSLPKCTRDGILGFKRAEDWYIWAQSNRHIFVGF
ncbi:hypothetical protein PGT21_031904 [Puccinia graminis f. sp. tritici]|uniref:Uncharacterized protein n=1 Tax=Puccinia graminis f. sp. tritici TaxID=56615 RepID=A0A5B0MQ47_PUCGR|nr:hypothetical protein PGTUg99_005582 [Puccinia graminis f. sp. tritici]KAA1094879.1 hypothetical protein PGT21_031904 [Puccinia graminis f. sp. tritici]